MTSFLKSAKYVHDIDSDISYVEIVYDRYVKDRGYISYTDYIETEPLADWTYLQSQKMSIQYDKFLDTMVKKTLEVRQRLAELIIENILTYDQENTVYVRIAHAVKIIDPTFQPPYVNMDSAWQMEFLKKFCKKQLTHPIRECKSMSRLEYFIRVLRIIELGQ
jgi:hypothetical protein